MSRPVATPPTASTASGPGSRELFETVLGPSSAPTGSARRIGHGVGWGIAVAAHVVLLLLASRTEPSLENWAAEIAASIHADLAAAAPVVIDPPAQPPPPMVAEQETAPEPPEQAPPVEPAEPAAAEPPPRTPPPSAPPETERRAEPAPVERPPAEPAQAGTVMTADPANDAPVDLTDNTFITGTGSHYAGGASSADGTGQVPVDLTELAVVGTPGATVAPPQSGDAGQTEPRRRQRSAARPVQLRGGEWRCDWPEQAIAEDIYEQSVVVRVVVNVDGEVVDTIIVDDPGFGFGAAAATCARARRFSPARDDDGAPIQATSPAIRVRFTR